MPGPAAPPPSNPAIDALLKQALSIDAAERLEAVEQLRKYAGIRKVNQVAYELRNDADRRVREAARTILEEADRRTSGSLALPGQVENERDVRIDELLAELNGTTPFERVSALKQLEFFLPHPRIEAALEKLRKDPDRTIRLLVIQLLEERAARARDGEKPKVNQIEDGVLVASPYSKKHKKAWRESQADRMGPEMVPFVGFLYLAVGVPSSALSLWMWVSAQNYIDPALAPSPALERSLEAVLGVDADPLTLALMFGSSMLMTLGGVGLMLRREWGRRSILLYHAILALFGFAVPGLFPKFFGVGIAVVVIYFLTRPEIARSFKGYDDGKKGPPPTNYGDMERKTW